MRIVATLLAVLIALAPSVAAAQGEPREITNRAEMNAFLALYQGVWQGRGNSRPTTTDAFDITRCEINSTYDAATAALTSGGNCANLRGTTPLDGSLGVDGRGDLAGTFFSRSRGVEMVSSSGGIYEDRIVLDQVYRAEVNRVMQTYTLQVQVFKPTGNSYTMVALMLEPTTQTWGEVTRITFTKD